MTWFVVVMGLVLLVFLHELGHFSVALAVGMRPRSFYIGFPPAVVKTKRNGIEYGIGAIPLGGLVRIPGMHRPAARDLQTFISPAMREDATLAAPAKRVQRALQVDDFDAARAGLPDLRDAVRSAKLTERARRSADRALREVDDGTGSDAYWRQATWKRIAVIAAGPVMNILVAFLIFLIVYATGAPSNNLASTKVAQVEANSPAASAGLQVGDKVVAVDGKPTPTFDTVRTRIIASHGKPITVTVDRGGNRVTLPPRATKREGNRYVFGFLPAAELISHPIGSSARLAASDCWNVVTGTFGALGGLVHSKERGQLTSTVGIVRVSQQALRVDFNYYLQIVGFVSMSLALLNLLPFLPLDGGHILFSVLEAVRRRAIAREVYERVSVVGFSLIILIFLIAFSNDLGGHSPG
ncbi:MAG TPA: M50 family metallopeptidase [Gaiellaceae bacterium]|jgi:regulator of sigma E protease|nr:M50 family metallopeptidase [Gaiellaceae bacterium]